MCWRRKPVLSSNLERNAMSNSAVEAFRGAIQAGDIALVQSILQSQPKLGKNALVNAVFGVNAVKVENFLREERIYLDSDGGDSDGGALLLFFRSEQSKA
ncbi:hypothetical protein Ae201684P_016881 [Aphanomyces euteiches]|nr:hypothetical protein Ae201684P_016881 [Aphanomyces euteiches]